MLVGRDQYGNVDKRGGRQCSTWVKVCMQSPTTLVFISVFTAICFGGSGSVVWLRAGWSWDRIPVGGGAEIFRTCLRPALWPTQPPVK